MTITLNTETHLDVDLDALALQALEADMLAKETADLAKGLKDKLKTVLTEQGLYNSDFKGTDHVRTVIKETSRFDPKKALELLNADEVAQCSALSGTLVKANVAPAVYTLMQSPGTTSLELKIA